MDLSEKIESIFGNENRNDWFNSEQVEKRVFWLVYQLRNCFTHNPFRPKWSFKNPKIQANFDIWPWPSKLGRKDSNKRLSRESIWPSGKRLRLWASDVFGFLPKILGRSSENRENCSGK